MTRGALYYAVGEEYVEQARESAESLKKHMPELGITIATDQDNVPDVFDRVIKAEVGDEHPFLNRIQYFSETSYDRTLYLDADTYICGSIPELFNILDRFDIAVSPASVRIRKELEDVPASFPEFNAGIVVYNQSDAVTDVFETFEEQYQEHLDGEGHIVDQPALRETLYHSDLDIGVIPPEYNCRFGGPTFVNGEVKILHGTHPDMEAMAEAVNRETSKRVLTGDSDRRIFAEPKPMRVIPYPGPGRYRGHLQALSRSLREDGIRETVRQVMERAGRLV